ncbi:cytochrome P450 [Streptomyces sp. HNM0574]|uniref:cytochrome P450 n=1 Tax=Streptomyces sp. HNM0574 TaxID=2714954 RepID=UPI00146DB644|nr:cytochrome P450 [Streptomyces sp. HNM0574]NLU68972.1 cytochrome P450 [Streptomyces sp. HNM0574]
MYGPDFAADPSAVYARLRRSGPIAPVELAPGVDAQLVLGFDAALHVLRSPETFSKDPRRWRALNEGIVPADSPVVPMMMHRPNCLFADGEEHRRLREAVSDSLDHVDPAALRGYVEQSADTLIDRFAPTGEADLLGEYAQVLPLLVFNQLFGCPPDLGDKLVEGMSGIFDGVDAEAANALLTQTTAELVALKRRKPGPDVTSWLIAHQAGLNDEEMMHHIVVLMGAGTEPQQNLIANGLRLLLADDRFSGSLSGGSLPVEDALDEVLWMDPPMANYGVHFAVRDTEYAGVPIRAGEPLVVSFAAANTDPSIASDQRAGNRAHLAWSAGPHSCPAQGPARLIAAVAVEKLLDRLPDMELALPVDQLIWRPGPFHRALQSLPVRFPATAVSSADGRPETADAASATAAGAPGVAGAADASSGAPAPITSSAGVSGGGVPAARPSQGAQVPGPRGSGPRRMWSSLRAWWRGGE